MSVLAHISDIIIPVLIFFIVGYGFVSKVKVYETFLDGAKDGLKVVIDIVPTLIGLLVAVGMLRASGFFELLGKLLAPVTTAVGLPASADREAVLLLGGHRAGAGYFQNLRSRLLCGDADLYTDELYGDGLLHHERLFPGGQGDKDQIYLDRGAAFHPSGDGGKRGADAVDGVKNISFKI